MSVYESRIIDAKGYEQVSDYLWDLNERIKYYFSALTPDDNFTEEAYQEYLQKGPKLSLLEETEKGYQNIISDFDEGTYTQVQTFYEEISLLVNKGEVTAALNIEADNINIKGDRLRIRGDNLKLSLDGDLEFHGEVIAELGDIGGWFIAGGEDQKYLGGTKDSLITVDTLESDHELYFNDVKVHGDTDLSNSSISLSGAAIETDKRTIFEDGFKAFVLDCNSYTVTCGTARSYGEIRANGQITCATCYTSADGSTWSDVRLKKDIKDITLDESREFLEYAVPFTYERRDTGRHEAGFMAQDLIMAEKDIGIRYGVTSERNGLYTVSYKALIPFLVKELQKQTEDIEEICRQRMIL